MNGVHDMGGEQGMGPVQYEKDEPVFHARWEGRVYAINRTLGAWGKWNLDASRHGVELIPPADYLRMSYYERWLERLINMSIKSGLVTREEVESGKPASGSSSAAPPVTAANAETVAWIRASARRPDAVAPRFAVGQVVRTRNMNPIGHTRLPRYARASPERSNATMASSCSRIPTPIFLGRSRSTSIRFVSRHANCGVTRPSRRMPSTSICSMTTSNQPDSEHPRDFQGRLPQVRQTEHERLLSGVSGCLRRASAAIVVCIAWLNCGFDDPTLSN